MKTGMNNEGSIARRFGITILALVFLAVAVPFTALLGSQIPFIYYWDFNHTQAHLAALPDVVIKESWKHEDISLEDCFFTLQVRDCPRVRLDFLEGQNWRNLLKEASAVSVTWRDGIHSESLHRSIDSAELRGLGCRKPGVAEIIANLESILHRVEAAQSDSLVSLSRTATLNLVVLAKNSALR
jgi:hypothetical protein